MLKKPLFKLCVGIFGLMCHYMLYAEGPYSLCKNPPPTPADQQSTVVDPNTPAEFTADRASRDESGIATMEGSVHMTRGTQTVTSEVLTYDEKSRKIQASGNVRAEDTEFVIESQEAELHLDSDYAKTREATYHYKPMHARGSADSIERESENVVRLENSTYTTCEEDDRAWILSADDIELDKSEGQGVGKNVVVKFKDVPIFYTPWIRFPIDDRRKTGFLVPTIGNTKDSGFELETPFYWNIAPNRDAIFSPRLLTDRGVQLQTNFRYLNKKDFGQLDLEYLDDSEFDDDRYLTAFQHSGYYIPRLNLDLLYNKVSDDNYFEDLGEDIGLTSTVFLERRGDLRYYTDHWNFLSRVQDFQTVDETLTRDDEPYERLPQFLITGKYFSLPGGFDLESTNEWTSFDHDSKVDGDRLHLGLELERPFESTGYFFRPGVRIRHTEYDLNRSDNLDDDPSTTVPSTFVDAGLIFERNMKKFANIQTLEPRLYYLNTPFENQDNIPIFDTAEFEFGFDQLFRNDRFSGRDRDGDADQLSVALTSRVLDVEEGEEKFRASIGHIFYFRDRKVTLPDEPVEDEDTSEIAAELKIALSDRWNANASTLYDPHDDHTERNSLRLQYITDNDFILNMSYRYRRRDIEPVDPLTNQRSNLEQSDISMVLPINKNWRAVGRWNYDIEERRELDVLAAIEYDTCCWKFRIAGRRFNQNADEDYNNSIQVQLVLKGLGQIGSELGDLLERGVRGFDDRDDRFF